MASFKIVPNREKGLISLRFFRKEANPISGNNEVVLACEHVFRADIFQKMLDAGADAMQMLKDVAEAAKSDAEFDSLSEEDIC